MADLSSIKILDEAPTTNYEVMPDGWYVAEVIESDFQTSDKGNRYLGLTFQINDDNGSGQFIGRRVWAILNLEHPTGDVRKRAQMDYSSLVRSLKLARAGDENATVKDSVELHGIPVDIRLMRKDSEGYGPKSEIKQYRTSSGAATPPQKTQAGNGSSNGRPWES
jgi:hypothetical protein